MKKLLYVLSIVSLLLISGLTACGSKENEIVVGATPSPHAEILNSKAVQDYVKSKGYTLTVKVYQDYIIPNKALNTNSIDANFFQHIPYLEAQMEEYGYDFAVACEVHNEPLNLYGKNNKTDWSNTTISIVNDPANVERAYKLLVANGLLDSYSVEDFNAQKPVYTSSVGVKIECIDPVLLSYKVNQGGYAVIPGNYALAAWGATEAASYKIFGESTEVAYPNIIAVRTEDLDSEKIRVLVEALGQESVKEFIEQTYGPTVNYVFKSYLK